MVAFGADVVRPRQAGFGPERCGQVPRPRRVDQTQAMAAVAAGGRSGGRPVMALERPGALHQAAAYGLQQALDGPFDRDAVAGEQRLTLLKQAADHMGQDAQQKGHQPGVLLARVVRELLQRFRQCCHGAGGGDGLVRGGCMCYSRRTPLPDLGWIASLGFPGQSRGVFSSAANSWFSIYC